ncbi:hypothetical protein MRS44_003515 [Fusarium solani]|jgi:hypothetical protein|uniref:Uncharacterized protein n=1 Tax=Fusarium solani TaxID=169388 RepID=A0A9P9L2L2_FUSSL|nr:uncharacterized protein B0J15DRAFT_193128 [Fusarium solani]KAH7273016.1 hypothetical protein B0J15DRAFT_193128 [Fusarium solani]KAJ3469450.1 hypothetical protein MRS44_003515 [Fusarium solani]
MGQGHVLQENQHKAKLVVRLLVKHLSSSRDAGGFLHDDLVHAVPGLPGPLAVEVTCAEHHTLTMSRSRVRKSRPPHRNEVITPFQAGYKRFVCAGSTRDCETSGVTIFVVDESFSCGKNECRSGTSSIAMLGTSHYRMLVVQGCLLSTWDCEPWSWYCENQHEPNDSEEIPAVGNPLENYLILAVGSSGLQGPTLYMTPLPTSYGSRHTAP